MWYTKNAAGGAQGMVIDEKTGRTVAVSYDTKDTALLAAAPELLAVLQDCRNVIALALPKFGKKSTDRADSVDDARGLLHRADDAIAKATNP